MDINDFVSKHSANVANTVRQKGTPAVSTATTPAQPNSLMSISRAVAHAEKALQERWKYRLGAIGRKINGRVEVDCYTLITSVLFWDDALGSIGRVLIGSPAETILVKTNTQMAFNKATIKDRINNETIFRPGLILFKPGHVGICISETHSIEATPAGGSGIRKANIRGGLHTWTHWFEDVHFQYSQDKISAPERITVFSERRSRT